MLKIKCQNCGIEYTGEGITCLCCGKVLDPFDVVEDDEEDETTLTSR